MSTTDQKIDDLARMMAEGFSEVHKELADVRGDIADIQGDIADIQGGITDIRNTMATKADLETLRGDVSVMLDQHIGAFRKDYDELGGRVKTLEKAVLHR